MARRTRSSGTRQAENYRHPDSESPMRPDVGTQAQFKKKKPPVTYRYDSSLSPALDWDGQNSARELGEQQLSVISSQLSEIRELVAQGSPSSPAVRTKDLEKPPGQKADPALQALAKAEEAIQKLKALSKPFLNWAGKAERLSFDVPTLPLFVHERLSTKAIIETLTGHKRDKQQTMFELFGDPQHSVTDQVLRAYEHRDKWVNRMVLGDSLVVMNSLLHYEGLGGQVQMIYMDPPYGVKFGSNFQPFVRKRDVTHGDDDDMTREPEMVQAYRDTWELGLHSYLTYLRDRLLLARDLLTPSGSIFVQISDENLHHVRELMDEVFGEGNRVSQISFLRGGAQTSKALPSVSDFLLWYCRDLERLKLRALVIQDGGWAARSEDLWFETLDGDRRRVSSAGEVPTGAKLLTHRSLESATGSEASRFPIGFEEKTFSPKRGWSTSPDGVERLRAGKRLLAIGDTLRFVVYLSDYPFSVITNNWTDTIESGFASNKIYVVQTAQRVLQRCILMTTDPGDLVLDPTCGSGTTAYVAEQWGRRWITIDTSRVPLALARQRLLTATFRWYELKDEPRGPAGGFVYVRKQNKKGEEVGGIVPHVTLESIANNEPPKEEVLVDRPERDNKITRVTGPFCVEATIPTPVDWEADGIEDSGAVSAEEHGSFVDRMLEVLRKSPVLRLEGNRTVTLRNVRPPAKTLSLSAEALVETDVAQGWSSSPAARNLVGGQRPPLQREPQGQKADPALQKPVAVVFGPENGAVSETLVRQAAFEASGKRYTHLYVVGFAIQSNARQLIDNCEAVMGIPATYVQATPDIMMGDLLKNMRSSQIFSVCGLPDVELRPVKAKSKAEPQPYEVELLGLDVCDPVTMEVEHFKGNDVPAWFLDTDYNGLCFHVSQAFFPRTSAWDSLKKALKGEYDETVWEHLAGTVSAQFEAGQNGQVAVKVIDNRGNELLVVKPLSEAKG